MLRIFKFLMPMIYMSFAKVTGPLFSLTASGKLADCMVHFPWKGRQVVRQWLKPSNPKTAKQGQARLHLGGLGRACSKVVPTDAYAGYARGVPLNGNTWVSQLVKWMIDNKFTDYATFDQWIIDAGSYAGQAFFLSESIALGLVAFNIEPKLGTKSFSNPAQLSALAVYGYEMRKLYPTKFTADPYDTNPNAWTEANVKTMVTHMNSDL